MMNQAENSSCDLTIVIPSYNEGECLEQTFNEVNDVFLKESLRPNYVLVDDGSSDSTPQEIEKIRPYLEDHFKVN